jgi:Rrf2 family protein
MLSATADHALRAVLVLARDGGRGMMRADEIADAIGAPRNYMAKTLGALAKAGLVTSARGPLGGFALAVAPETLTLARVIDLFDEPRRQTRCMLGNAPCDPNHPCAAHHRWLGVLEARRAPLAGTTVADLLQGYAPRIAPSPAAASVAASAA